MNIDQRMHRRFHFFAAWAFVIAALALWVPISWEADRMQPGTLIHVDLGVLKPLRVTWHSSADGFWFGFSEVRGVAFALSAVLTAAVVVAAREMFRRSRPTAAPLVTP